MTNAEKREAEIKEIERTVIWLEGYVAWLKELKDGRMATTHTRSD